MENNNINSVTNAPVLAKKGTFPATVAKVIDDYKLVINRGLEHGIREGQRMLVYRMSDEEIKDPNTGESLGCLELVRGTGKIIFIQEKISIIESDKKIESSTLLVPQATNNHIEINTNSIDNLYIGKILENHHLFPFDNPQIGDQVKPI